MLDTIQFIGTLYIFLGVMTAIFVCVMALLFPDKISIEVDGSPLPFWKHVIIWALLLIVVVILWPVILYVAFGGKS